MKNFLFLLTCLTLSGLALPSYADFCNFPYSEPIEGEFAEVGQAVDSDRERFKVLNAFKGQKTEVGGGMASLSASLLTNYEEIFKKINKNKQGSIKISFFEFGKSKNFTKTVLNQKYTATFVAVFETTISNGKWEIDTNSGSPLTEYAKSFLSTPCEFKRLFGDSFIFQTQRGAQVYIAINVSFSSNAQYQEFTKGMGTGNPNNMGSTVTTKLSDWITSAKLPSQIGNIELGGSFKSGSDKVSKSTLENGKVEIVAMQVGGDTTRLGQIFGANGDVGIASCRLSALVDDAGKSKSDATLTDCSKSFYNALAYLAQEEFATGVKQYPIVLSYLSRPYWEVDPSIQLVKELTPAIETAREQLAQELLKREADLSTLKNLLSNFLLTTSHRQELITLQLKLEQDIQQLTTVGFTCFSDLANCESMSIQVLNRLTTYSPNVFIVTEKDMSIGLIGRYSFDGNAQDKSGRGNDGIERNTVSYVPGKFEQAAKFTDGYVEIPDIKDFTFKNQSLTFSVWTTIAHNYKYVYIPFISLGWETGYDLIHLGKERGGITNGGIFMYIQGQGKVGLDSLESGANLLAKYKNDWLYITGVVNYEEQTLKLYLNGQLQGTKKLTSSFQVSPNAKLFIGDSVCCKTGEKYYSYQSGLMDEVRIYDRALSEEEVQHLYIGNTFPETYHLTTNQIGSGNITGAGDYEANSSVTLTAIASTDSKFTGWSGDCAGTANSTTVLMDTNKICMANFSKNTVTGSTPCDNPFLPCDKPETTGCTASYQNNSLVIPCRANALK